MLISKKNYLNSLTYCLIVNSDYWNEIVDKPRSYLRNRLKDKIVYHHRGRPYFYKEDVIEAILNHNLKLVHYEDFKKIWH